MKKVLTIVTILLVGLSFVHTSYGQAKKTRIFVVNSYHKEYLWEQQVNEGFCAAMLDFKFLNNKTEVDEYTRNDYVETDKVVLKRVWMDSKRKNSISEIEHSAVQILDQIKEFKPDLIILGDDNASNYIGNQYIDTDIPVIFRGIVGTPMKYGLGDSVELPGHNITGVLKPGYPKEIIEYFLKLVPSVKTFAILSDSSETARAKAKEVVQLLGRRESPLTLVETVLTNSYPKWQTAALRLQNQADAFLILNHNTLKDEEGVPVDPLKVAAWYFQNIKVPEMSWEKQFVDEGFLMTVDDSAFKQGYEVVRMAHMVIHENKNPAYLPCIVPARGKIIVNRQRAQMLGIGLSDKNFIEEYVDKSLALEKYPTKNGE